MIAYLLASLATAIGQLFELFGITFALAWALYHVSMGMRRLGAERLGLGYFFAVAPGVACHETGHALGCLLTGKKIVEFVPFRPQVEGDGVTLGYVRHASSPSILSRAGEFVVATGPVWFGGIVVLCIVRLLVGAAPFESLAGSNQTPTSFFHYLGSVMEAASSLASRAFALWHWHGVFDVVLVYLLVCVASEITLSGPDLRGMWVGLAAICTLVVVGNMLPFFDAVLEAGMSRLRPWLFSLHATLAFALALDVCFYAIYRAADAALPTKKNDCQRKRKMNAKHGSCGLSALGWTALACLILLVLFSGRLSSGRPKTAAGRIMRDAALAVEEVSTPDVEEGDTPSVVRRQLAALKKKENEEWTDRNIRRNPVLYLEHCKELLGSLREDLLDMQFGARVERTRLLRVSGEEKEIVRSKRSFLTEAERIVSSGVPFPVTIDGFKYDAAAFTNAVREADAAAPRAENAAAAHAAQAERAQELSDYFDETLAALANELAALPLEIQATKSQEAREAAETVRSRIGRVLDGVHTLSRPPAVVSTGADKKDAPSLSAIFSRNYGHNPETENTP